MLSGVRSDRPPRRRGTVSMGATRGGDFLRSKKYNRSPIYTVHGNTLPPAGWQINLPPSAFAASEPAAGE